MWMEEMATLLHKAPCLTQSTTFGECCGSTTQRLSSWLVGSRRMAGSVVWWLLCFVSSRLLTLCLCVCACVCVCTCVCVFERACARTCTCVCVCNSGCVLLWRYLCWSVCVLYSFLSLSLQPKCEKYWPEKGDSATFGDITVHTVSCYGNSATFCDVTGHTVNCKETVQLLGTTQYSQYVVPETQVYWWYHSTHSK